MQHSPACSSRQPDAPWRPLKQGMKAVVFLHCWACLLHQLDFRNIPPLVMNDHPSQQSLLDLSTSMNLSNSILKLSGHHSISALLINYALIFKVLRVSEQTMQQGGGGGGDDFAQQWHSCGMDPAGAQPYWCPKLSLMMAASVCISLKLRHEACSSSQHTVGASFLRNQSFPVAQ